VGYDLTNINYDTTKYVGAKSKVLSVQKLDKIWAIRPRTTLGEGLKFTLNWFMQHKEILLPKNTQPSAVA